MPAELRRDPDALPGRGDGMKPRLDLVAFWLGYAALLVLLVRAINRAVNP